MSQDIAKKAYFLWERAGKPEGKDLDFWLAAERLLNRKPITIAFIKGRTLVDIRKFWQKEKHDE